MNQLSKIEMANLVLNDDKKSKIKDMLCTFYGATDVGYKDLSYGIRIEVVGTDSFRFIRNAIGKVLEVTDDTITILEENDKTLSASYVYLPEKDRNLNKKLKKMGLNK